MKTAEYWIDKIDEISSDRDQENWIKAIQAGARQSAAREAAEVVNKCVGYGECSGIVAYKNILAHFKLEDK